MLELSNVCGAIIEDATNFYISKEVFCCKKCFDEWEKGK
nr:MAG TPA: protein of unknown function (DUF3330) [Caudoviricetes sp.]